MNSKQVKISKMDPKTLTKKEKSGKLDYFMINFLKIENFHSSESTIKRGKRQPTE